MKRTCAYPGCGGSFEAKRSDARYCSDTCRAKASKDRARTRREVGRRTRGGGVTASDAGDASALAARLAAMEARLVAAEAGVARAEADRARWKKVRDQLQAALGRVEDAGRAPAAETIAAAVRSEVGPQLAKLARRLDGVQAAQDALRGDIAYPSASGAVAETDDLLVMGKEIGKLRRRIRMIERELRIFSQGEAEAIREDK